MERNSHGYISQKYWQLVVGKTIASVDTSAEIYPVDVRITFTDGTVLDLGASYDDSGAEIVDLTIK